MKFGYSKRFWACRAFLSIQVRLILLEQPPSGHAHSRCRGDHVDCFRLRDKVPVCQESCVNGRFTQYFVTQFTHAYSYIRSPLPTRPYTPHTRTHTPPYTHPRTSTRKRAHMYINIFIYTIASKVLVLKNQLVSGISRVFPRYNRVDAVLATVFMYAVERMRAGVDTLHVPVM